MSQASRRLRPMNRTNHHYLHNYLENHQDRQTDRALAALASAGFSFTIVEEATADGCPTCGMPIAA